MRSGCCQRLGAHANASRRRRRIAIALPSWLPGLPAGSVARQCALASGWVKALPGHGVERFAVEGRGGDVAIAAAVMVPRGTVLPMTTMTLREFRDGAGRVLEAVERTHEPVIITKYERPVAVLIGIDEWEELEAFRDRKDSAAIARSRAEGQFVPLAAALESLGVNPREVEALLADRTGGEAA